MGIRDFIKNSADGNGIGIDRSESERIFNSANADTIERLLEQIVDSRGLVNGKGNRVIKFNSVKRTAEQRLTAMHLWERLSSIRAHNHSTLCGRDGQILIQKSLNRA